MVLKPFSGIQTKKYWPSLGEIITKKQKYIDEIKKSSSISRITKPISTKLEFG